MSEHEEQRAITLTLIDEKPISWNKMYAGLHWSKRKDEADRVHLAVRVALDSDWLIFENPVEGYELRNLQGRLILSNKRGSGLFYSIGIPHSLRKGLYLLKTYSLEQPSYQKVLLR